MPLASSNLLLTKLVSKSPSIEKNPIQNPTMSGNPKNQPSKIPAAMLPIIPRIVLWRPSSGFPSKNVRFQSMGRFHLSSNKNAITGGAALTAKRRIMILSPMSIMMESPSKKIAFVDLACFYQFIVLKNHAVQRIVFTQRTHL